MVEFLRSLTNAIMIIIAILGFTSIFLSSLKSPLVSLISITIVVLVGFIFLIVYYFSKIENRILDLEERYKKAYDLIDIKSRLKNLEWQIQKKGIK